MIEHSNPWKKDSGFRHPFKCDGEVPYTPRIRRIMKPELKSNINDYQGNTNDEKVLSFLKEAKAKGFFIIPMIDVKMGKGYTVYKTHSDGEEEAYMPVLHGDWLDDFPKVPDSAKELIDIHKG